MTKIVNRLLEKEYITEEKPDKIPSGGRIPGLLRINTAKNHIVGLDINKTGLKATLTFCDSADLAAPGAAQIAASLALKHLSI